MDEIVTFGGHVTALDAPGEEANEQISKLLALVGNRVRSGRTRIGLSRRMLSEKSGVSQRYLAQLEGGHGNISIALLMRIAHALDLDIELLIAEADPWNSDLGTISSLLRSATKAQREGILAILDPEKPDLKRGGRIALIGLRGAGKSTLGQLSAERLGLPFLELNDEIEVASGIPVHEVIALYGQEGYRHLEHQALERIVATRDMAILAVAGGIVSHPETFNYLLGNCHTIWLKADPEEHMARVRGQGDERPMAGNPNAMAELRNILQSRETLYSRAAACVNTSGKTLDETLTRVLATIEENEFLKQ